MYHAVALTDLPASYTPTSGTVAGLAASDGVTYRAWSSAWASLNIAADNTVTIISKHIEFGQGPFTGLATIVAEELDADRLGLRSLAQPLFGWVSDRRPRWCLVAYGPLLAAAFIACSSNS